MAWPSPPPPEGPYRKRAAPVVVTATPPDAARELQELLADYHAALVAPDRIELELVDSVRRGTVIYRVVQAAQTVAARHADADLHFVAEDGNRWRLPPPPL